MPSQTLIEHFDTEVVVPTLAVLGRVDARLDSVTARQLLVGTAVHESAHFDAPLQYGGGPARSYFQIEPFTFRSLLQHEIQADWVAALDQLVPQAVLAAAPGDGLARLEGHLIWNDWLACAVARLKYWTAPEALPQPNDWPAIARYWKRWYNTADGKGTREKFLADNRDAIAYFERLRRVA